MRKFIVTLMIFCFFATIMVRLFLTVPTFLSNRKWSFMFSKKYFTLDFY